MWSLRVCALVCVCAAVAATCAAELRCVHPQCVVVRGGTGQKQHFSVEDHDFRVTHKDRKYDVSIDCGGWRTLESPAMPSYTSLVHASSVKLSSCPAPSNGSLADALAALNVTLLQDDGTFGNLTFVTMPHEPPLAAHHFTGLERISGLSYHAVHNKPLPTAGFLANLRSLQSLEFTNVRLPAGELDDPPPTLRLVRFHKTGLERLPKALLTLPDLQNLIVYDKTTFTVVFEEPPRALRELKLHSSNTTLRLDELPTVEEIRLVEWTERHPAALKRCDELRSLVLKNLAAEGLPERWVAACPRLLNIHVEYMRDVASLPPKLLENASALTSLSFINGVLETLPEGLLKNAQNLAQLYLYRNHLHTIPSDTFLGPRALNDLDLSHNQLHSNIVDALAPLRELVSLDLSLNPSLGDLCDNNGYSVLNSNRLKSLYLSSTNITRICRDWRENLTFLEKLDLKRTQISKLRYADFQYKRDASVRYAQVILYDTPITSVLITEDDYKKSRTAPPTGVWVHVGKWPECDCRMYWARLMAHRASHAFRVMPIPCFENHLTEVCAPTTSAAPTTADS